jgi:hypothetical protein
MQSETYPKAQISKAEDMNVARVRDKRDFEDKVGRKSESQEGKFADRNRLVLTDGRRRARSRSRR